MIRHCVKRSVYGKINTLKVVSLKNSIFLSTLKFIKSVFG